MSLVALLPLAFCSQTDGNNGKDDDNQNTNQDGIANSHTMKKRINNLRNMVSNNAYYAYVGLSHGFGLGTIAVVKGRINLANTFLENRKR